MANITVSGGRYVASAFGAWRTTTLNTQASGSSVLINLASSPVVAAADGTNFQPFATNAPLIFGFGLASQETVTPSAISYTAVPGAVQVTVTTSNNHNSGETVLSGSFGLQEAINFAHNGPGGLVVIDQGYLGTTTTIAAATGFSNVSLEDTRVGAYDRLSVYTLAGATDAIPVQAGPYFVTRAGVDAATLATPVAGSDDGKTITVVSTTANAHTITTAANKIVPSHSVVTFSTTLGAFVTLTAFNGLWYVGAQANITSIA